MSTAKTVFLFAGYGLCALLLLVVALAVLIEGGAWVFTGGHVKKRLAILAGAAWVLGAVAWHWGPVGIVVVVVIVAAAVCGYAIGKGPTPP